MSQAKGGRSGSREETPPEPEASAAEEAPSQGHGHECLEWCPICRSTELLKGVTSPEVRQQLQAIQSEAVQVFKAFAAAYTERTSEDPFSRDRGGTSDNGGRREPEPPRPPEAPIDISIE